MCMDQWLNDDKQVTTEELGENLLQCHFVHYKSHLKCHPGQNADPRGEKPASSRLSSGTVRYMEIIL
jgi:hypothetical protein